MNDRTLQENATAALYDTQTWLYLDQNYTSLTFDATALAQNDSFGYGPGLMVNGLSNSGYWYQVGLIYNWWYYGGQGHSDGFSIFFQVWNASSDQSVYPYTDGGSLTIPLNTLEPGDNVLLSLYFSGGNVSMKAQDLRTGDLVIRNYTAFGATSFVGSPQSSEFPTSLLNEWPHVLPYLCINQTAHFSTEGQAINYDTITIDEWNFTGYPPSEFFDSSEPGQFFLSSPLEAFTFQSPSELFYFNYLGMGVFVTPDSFVTM